MIRKPGLYSELQHGLQDRWLGGRWSKTERALKASGVPPYPSNFVSFPPPCSGGEQQPRCQGGLGSLWVPGVWPSPSGDELPHLRRVQKGWIVGLRKKSRAADSSSTSSFFTNPTSVLSLRLWPTPVSSIALFSSPHWQNHTHDSIYIMRLWSGLHSGLCGS